MNIISYLTIATIVYTKTVTIESGEIKDCKEAGTVVLTFDDGPSENTGKVLDLLNEKGVKGAFFFLGANMEKYPDLVRRAYDEGHVIGSHSWDHAHFNSLSISDVQKQIIQTNNLFLDMFDCAPIFFRFPYFEFNQESLDCVNQLKMEAIFANIDSMDYSFPTSNESEANKDVMTALKDRLNNADPTKDSFIHLQHEIRLDSVLNLSDIIDFVLSKGFRISPLNVARGHDTPYRKYTRLEIN